ncbi:MAG: DNA repair protein RecN [Desulfobacterales bacterium]|nr:DNA repair protein RecN [Desulfobacterales bacterium]
MLRELSIRNFAIIDDLQICFSKGLTILSGETGAGKSIIINAVNLLLGSRATAKLIRTGAETAELEALFEVAPGSHVAEAMEAYGYNTAEGLLLRRLISRNDRHRIYINGRPATMQLLNAVTENLACISGQHAHQGLLKEEEQLTILDHFGGLMPLREQVGACFHDIVPLLKKLRDFYMKRDSQTQHMELLEFQKKEIEEAGITPGEDIILGQEQLRLRNGEVLYQTVHESMEELYSANGAIFERLITVKKDLEKAGRIDPELSGRASSLEQTVFQIEDIVDQLRAYIESIQLDEKRLEVVEARLDTLKRLKRKYGGSIETVLSHLKSIETELSELENISENIQEMEAELFEVHARLKELVLKLSSKRKQMAKVLSEKVETELATLMMPQTKFQVALETFCAGDNTDAYLKTDNTAITETGVDRATFMIAPNVGEALKPLAGIASGGELSRVVLALMAILAKTASVETAVFDEVDAGVGGSVAEVIGQKLFCLADYHQIICITHLPQIAKFAHHHYRISKQVADGRTTTTITELSMEERVEEIARMLGGVKITQATFAHAREMIQNR